MKPTTFTITRAVLGLILFLSCAGEQNFGIPELPCEAPEIANATLADVKSLYQGETRLILEDLVVSGYINSSDQEGNFFGSLHFQDNPESATGGLQLELDLRDAYLLYPPGSLVFIRLKGLYIGFSAGTYKLGGPFPAFGNLSIGRLPAAAVPEHLFPGCEAARQLKPKEIPVSGLNDTLLNTLVRINGLSFTPESHGQPLAPEGEEAIHQLTDCQGNKIKLRNSGYSDFRAAMVPAGLGSITGVLQKEGAQYALVIRDLTDMEFQDRECSGEIAGSASDRIFISELADPDNNLAARFLELSNKGDSPINLRGWKLLRYTNENIEVGAALDLSGHVITPNSTLVVASDTLVFRTVYGRAADLQGGRNGPADSNGDDNLVLTDPFGEVVDIFGRIGEDGTGTDHEFEDGRAVRKSHVTGGNAVFDASEWDIFNDSGQSGTLLQPQQAPEDFNPGIHP